MIKIEKQHLKIGKLNVFTIAAKNGDREAGAKLIGWGDFFNPDVVLFTTGFSMFSILWILLRRRCVYYFWGFGKSRNVRLKIKKYLLSKCRTIVNSKGHLAQIKNEKNSCILLPLWIDDEFLNNFKNSKESEYLFVPGSNGRNIGLVNDLALRNYDIHVASPKCIEGIKCCCHQNLSDREYFKMFSSSKLVLLPVQNDGHLPGQTTALEAMYLGKQVLITGGDTAEILPTSVVKVPDNEPLSWEKAIKLAISGTYVSPIDINYKKVLQETINFIEKVSN